MSRERRFFFNDTATTEIYTLSLHDALPISGGPQGPGGPPHLAHQHGPLPPRQSGGPRLWLPQLHRTGRAPRRSEEHTSELQSRQYLVCRLLLEKKTDRLLRLCLARAASLAC